MYVDLHACCRLYLINSLSCVLRLYVGCAVYVDLHACCRLYLINSLSCVLRLYVGCVVYVDLHACCRLYLINSPVVRADNLRFKEEGVRDVLKDVFLPWFNAHRFLMQNIERLKKVRAARGQPAGRAASKPDNPLLLMPGPGSETAGRLVIQTIVTF